MSSAQALEASREEQLFDILYANDTTIFGTSAPYVQEFVPTIERAGKRFCTSLNWAGSWSAMGRLILKFQKNGHGQLRLGKLAKVFGACLHKPQT